MNRWSKKQGLMLYFTLGFGALTFSSLINAWINAHMEIHQSWAISPFLHLTHVRNHGGVFGLAQGMGGWFSLFSFFFLVGITAYVLFSKTIQPHEYLGFGLIFGGGGANILDRILYGAVIDYFDIQGIPYWHYIFNTADVMIHLGLWSMVFIELFRRKPIHDDSHA